MAATQTQWQLTGDYFENCNCGVVCPCLFSPSPPLTATPTQGACEVAFAFHVDQGRFDSVPLDGLNVAMIARSPGPMADGNMAAALYLDERADEPQRAALQAIFTGGAGGPMGALAPLISTILGVKAVPITFTRAGKRRAVEIPNVMQMAVQALPSMKPSGEEIWASAGHPFNPERLALAVGEAGSTWADYGMHWDNSGKNGHYAAVNWSGS
jgi:hypothetical protein